MWPAVIGAAGSIGAGLIGGIMGSNAADDAAEAQLEAQKRMEARLDASALEVEGYVDDYFTTLDQLDASFDPYNIEEAFASLYEGVIVPMERDFEEFVLPSLTAAYSGGVFGGESYLSGAAKEAEMKARQQLSTDKAKLRAGERESAISRNVALDERDRNNAAGRLEASTIAPMMRAGQATSIYGAESDTIAAQFAASSALTNSILNLPSLAASGAEMGGTIADQIRAAQAANTGE